MLLAIILIFTVVVIMAFIITYKIINLWLKKRWIELKKLLFGLSLVISAIFLLWIAFIFPYPHCTKKQIEVMKQELIDGIIQREIKLRELSAKANGNAFIQTEAFTHQLQKEKEKFYKYCNNDLLYDNNNCEITRKMEIAMMDRYSIYTLKYHLDEESSAFFNQVTTYWGYEKFSIDRLPRQDWRDALFGIKPIPIQVWYDQFWIASEKDYLLYPAKIVGYSSEHYYWGCQEAYDSYLIGTKELELASDEAVRREDLVFIESKSIQYKSVALDHRGRNRYASFEGIKTYIQREQK